MAKKVVETEQNKQPLMDSEVPKLIVKVALSHKDAKMPVKKSNGAACYDLYTCERTLVRKGRQVVATGIRMELPEGWEAIIRSKSGIASKGMPGCPKYLLDGGNVPMDIEDLPRMMDASVLMGTIDCDYRGMIGIIVQNTGEEFIIPAGVNLAQMKIQRVDPVMLVEASEDSLTKTERGEGGFGSNGIK